MQRESGRQLGWNIEYALDGEPGNHIYPGLCGWAERLHVRVEWEREQRLANSGCMDGAVEVSTAKLSS